MNRGIVKTVFALISFALISTQTTQATFTCWHVDRAPDATYSVEKEFWNMILQTHVAPASRKLKRAGAFSKGVRLFSKKSRSNNRGCDNLDCDNRDCDNLSCDIFGCSRKKNLITLPCCGKKICKRCMKGTCRGATSEVSQNSKLETVFVHPQALVYNDAKSPKETAKIERYERAKSAKDEPTWDWQTFNGHWYFRETEGEHTDRYWRYAYKESRNSPVHWRYVVAPKCPLCRKEFSPTSTKL